MLNMGVSEEFIEKYKDELEHNKTLFDKIKERIGCEGEQADVAMEFWLETYYKGMEISQVPETSMPLLYAFYAGYAYCKERYNLNE
jgi:hypothetical protein